GPAIALSLTVALAASLTLAPALLQLLGRHVFWPGKLPRPSAIGPRLSVLGDRPAAERRKPMAEGIWDRLSRMVVARPLLVWASAVLLLMPLAVLGFMVRPNYRATGELSPRSDSVRGLGAI